jgi:hypothetical protein
MPMTPSQFQVHRATIADLEKLRFLWKEATLPVPDLEKRLTEFQVVTDSEGELQGAIGLHILIQQGLIHSEAFAHPEVTEVVRPCVWDRLQVQAHNHGLLRFWTTEASPFWRHYAGFREPTAEELGKMPVDFGDAHSHWLVLPLREETNPVNNLDKELELFRLSQKTEMERLQRTARFFKTFATMVAVVLFIALVVAGVFLLRQNTFLPSH